MKSNEAQLKIIKDTVTQSILPEMFDELCKKHGDKKAKSLIDLTQPRIENILQSFSERQLLLKQEIKSESEFKAHILTVISEVKQRLMNDIEQT